MPCALGGRRPRESPTSRPADVRDGERPGTNTVFKPRTYATLDAWKARREYLRDQVRIATGLYPEPKRTPLNARTFYPLQRDGYTIQKVWFESYPGFYVTGNLYRPLNAKEMSGRRLPAGHWQKGARSQRASSVRPIITLARLGAVVFSYT